MLKKRAKPLENPETCAQLVEVGLEYADIQETLGRIVSKDFFKSVPRKIRRKELKKGDATDILEAHVFFHDKYMQVARQIDEILDIPGVEDAFNRRRASRNWADKPIKERYEIVSAEREKLQANQEKVEQKAAKEAEIQKSKEDMPKRLDGKKKKLLSKINFWRSKKSNSSVKNGKPPKYLTNLDK